MTELLVIMFGGLFISTSDPKYNDALKATANANYEKSEAKYYVDAASSKIAKDQPVATFVAGTGYAVATRREVKLKTRKLIPVDNVETICTASHNTAKIEFKFNF